jgi:hypothetical protein
MGVRLAWQLEIRNFMKTFWLVLGEMQNVDILLYVCSFCVASAQQPAVLVAVDCLVHMDIFMHLSDLCPPVTYIESFTEVAAPTGHVLLSHCLMSFRKRELAVGTCRLTWTPLHRRGGMWCCLYAQIFHCGAGEFFHWEQKTPHTDVTVGQSTKCMHNSPFHIVKTKWSHVRISLV